MHCHLYLDGGSLMQEVRYMISDTARKVDVEAHVLRYWEEELEIPIARNEMGHRYYTPDDIILLKNVKTLKEQGFQLRAIKILLPQLKEAKNKSVEQFFALREELNFQVSAMGQEVLAREKQENDSANTRTGSHKSSNQLVSNKVDMAVVHNSKVVQFQNILRSAISEALAENNFALEERVGDKVIKHVDYMLRVNEEKDDERFKKLDEAIRARQKMRREVAASDDTKGHGIGLFKKHKKIKKVEDV